MSMLNLLVARFKVRAKPSDPATDYPHQSIQVETLLRAYGDWVTLLATILEREHIITATELARLSSEYAIATAADHPEEGRILAFWASRMQDGAASLVELSSVH